MVYYAFRLFMYKRGGSRFFQHYFLDGSEMQKRASDDEEHYTYGLFAFDRIIFCFCFTTIEVNKWIVARLGHLHVTPVYANVPRSGLLTSPKFQLHKHCLNYTHSSTPVQIVFTCAQSPTTLGATNTLSPSLSIFRSINN